MPSGALSALICYYSAESTDAATVTDPVALTQLVFALNSDGATLAPADSRSSGGLGHSFNIYLRYASGGQLAFLLTYPYLRPLDGIPSDLAAQVFQGTATGQYVATFTNHSL